MSSLYKLLILIMFFPCPVHALYGLLGRNHCPYEQQSYPPNALDHRHQIQREIIHYEKQRQLLDAQISKISNQQIQLQTQIRNYFSNPWSEAMLSHMDNGYDCCLGDRVYSLSEKQKRKIASEVTQSQTLIPISVDEPPPLNNPPQITSTRIATCYGYDQKYCATSWQRGRKMVPPRGASQCPGSGFHQTPAWYYSACEDQGKINPQICANGSIASRPGEYARCMELLENYRAVSYQKRRMASLLQDINNSIYTAKYPNRPVPDSNGEVKKGGLLDGIGDVLNSVAKVAVPFVLQGGISYLQNRQRVTYSGNYGMPPIRHGNPTGPPRGAIRRGAVYRPDPLQSTFYGPNFGYPFSQGGSYGQINPGLLRGAFGCSQGSLGNAMNLAGALLSLGMNLKSPVRSFSPLDSVGAFGAFGGGALQYALNMALGNKMPGIQSWQLGVRQGPYHPGGLRFGTNIDIGNNGIGSYFSSLFQGTQSVPRYYTRQYSYGPRGILSLNNMGFDPRLQFGVSQPTLPTALNQTLSRIFTNNPKYDSYYYQQNLRDQLRYREQQLRMQALESYQNQSSFTVQARLAQLQDQLSVINNQTNRYSPYVYRSPDFYYRTRNDYSYQNPGFSGTLRFNIPTLLLHLGTGLSNN